MCKKSIKCEINLAQEQKNWYVIKKTIQKENMLREFPSIPEEAFYYAKEILKAKQEGRITKVSHDVYVDCFTAWDLGIGLNRYLDFSSTKK